MALHDTGVGLLATAAAPALSFAGPVVRAEGNSGTTNFTFTLNLARNGIAGAVPYSWAVTGSGANPATAADFAGGALPTGSGSFAAGETSRTISVGIAGDTIAEADEIFTITATATASTTLTASATGTILNDDQTGATLNALSLSGAAYAADAPAGTIIGAIAGKTAGSALALAPNDGRVILAGDDTAGWKLVKGLVASAAGTAAGFAITESKTGYAARSTTLPLTIAAAPAPVPIVANVRCGIAAVYNSDATASETSALAASSAARTKPFVAVAASATKTIAFKLGEAAPNGLILNWINQIAAVSTVAFATSTDSTTGADGTWTAVNAVNWTPTGGTSEITRGGAQPIPALPAGAWARIQITATAATSVALGLYRKPASGLMDIGVLIGMSITVQTLQAYPLERFLAARYDATRDPIILNLGVPGTKTTDMQANQVPILSAGIAAGVPVAYAMVDIGPNDTAQIRPRATNATAAAAFRGNIDALTAAIVAAGVPYARQYIADQDFTPTLTAPAVQSIADADKGTTPYNNNEVFAACKAQAYPASVHAGWDSHHNQHSVMTTLWMESQFSDGVTHPIAVFYPEEYRRISPMFRHLSGMAAGETFLEARVADGVRGGVTSAYRRQRLLDCIALLPATADPVALAVRGQAVAQVTALDTTAADYADPAGGFTLPSARAHPPAIWIDPARLAALTRINGGASARIAAITERSANAYTIARNSNGGVFHLDNYRNGRGVVRTCSVAMTGGVALDGETYTYGYLMLPAAAATAIDAAADGTVEWWQADYGFSSAQTYWGTTYLTASQATGFGGAMKITILSGGVSLTASVPPTPGMMHHYVLTYVAGTGVWTLWMDGANVGTMTKAKTGWATTAWNIGANAANTGRAIADYGDFIVTPGYAMTAADIADARAYGQAKWAAA